MNPEAGPPSGENTRPVRPHLPRPPAHLCQSCDEPWPCPPAQVDLVAEFYGRPSDLSMYLAGRYVEAVRDILSLNPDFDTTGMYERYLGWTILAERPRHRPQF